MTKTQRQSTTEKPPSSKRLVWAVAILVALIVGAGLFFAFGLEPDPVVETTPSTLASQSTVTSAASDEAIAADLATIESAVAAFYSGDGERAAQLFDLEDRTDDQVREESAYQAAIGGRLTLHCTGGNLGVFNCNVPYQNKMTEALGSTDHGDNNRVVVENGVIREFEFPEHSWLVLQFGTFLALEGRFDGYEACGFGPFPAWCAAIQLENLDAYVEWRRTSFEPAQVVDVALRAWYGGDCEQATFLGLAEFFDEYSWADCASGADQPASSPARMTAYESILGAEVTVENCEQLASGEDVELSCDVHYSNAMNLAVGKPAAVTTREFGVMIQAMATDPAGEQAWYRGVYPEDVELRESFQRFAEEGELGAEYTDAGCATDRTEVCASLILDNLDDWAAWYETNG